MFESVPLESKGYRATIEAAVGSGKADVLLERGDERLAVEISVTTTPEHEVENITKCLNADVSRVVVVSPQDATLRRIREKAHQVLSAEVVVRVLFACPDEFLATLTEQAAPEPKIVLGYKVKTKVSAPDAGSGDSRQQAIAQTIANALKRLKRQ